MPKKSNKTDHVLNLLTSGNHIDDTTAQVATPTPQAPSQSTMPVSQFSKLSSNQGSENQTNTKQFPHQSEPLHFNVAPQSSSRVVVEETKKKEELSNLVKIGLEEELKSFTKTKAVSKPFIVIDDNNNQNLGAPISQVYSVEDMEFVTSKPYILEDFNENEEVFMSNELTNEKRYAALDKKNNSEEFLHNMAEDIIKSKTPEIMESLNMCTCKSCIYDVVALALNNTSPLYTVTKKGELFQKLASCEMQYGSDITSEITKACLKIKVHPRHEL